MFGLPGEVYVILDEGPDLAERCSTSNERARRRARTRASGAAGAAGDGAAAVGGRPGAPCGGDRATSGLSPAGVNAALDARG